jgi:hypothetical protein
MNNDLEQVLRDSYGELVAEVRATTDTRRALAGLYARAAAAETTAPSSDATPSGVGVPATPSRRRRPVPGGSWRRLPAAAAVAAVLAAAVAAALVGGLAPVTPHQQAGTGAAQVLASAQPAAGKLLTTAAAAAARAPEPAFGPGQYWYVLERGVKIGTNLDQAGSSNSYFYRIPYRNETWWALDGSVSHRETSNPPQFLNSTERAAWIAAGRPPLGLPNTAVWSDKADTSDRSDGWMPMTYQQIIRLPTDPAQLVDALAERLRAGQVNGPWPLKKAPDQGARTPQRPPSDPRDVTGQELFGAIGFLLSQYPLPAELRAALYQALTRLDGIQLIGQATDLAGRHGVSVAIVEPDQGQPVRERSELILDPASSRLLGSRSVLIGQVPGWRLAAGTALDETVYLQASVVDSRTARP